MAHARESEEAPLQDADAVLEGEEATDAPSSRVEDAGDMDFASLWKSSRMTGWYDPVQLVRTAIGVAISALGARTDYRMLEALGDTEAKPFEHFADREELWLDYVADVGDGWNSTYAVASLIAAPALALGLPRKKKEHDTRRGALLVLGGDQVYPIASRRSYRERFVAPYACALDAGEEEGPDLYAIPGNHDWYDGLTAFVRMFCAERTIGRWRTRQKRSYFALRLPHRVWLLGLDVQLESDVDDAQVKYFTRIAETRMEDGDRVILCVPEPEWIYANAYGMKAPSTVLFLARRLRKKRDVRVVATIAGDLHHYRRHESGDSEHLFTAGGGGAFLHPTHAPRLTHFHGACDPASRPAKDEILWGPDERVKRFRKRFAHRKSFPTARQSRALAKQNLYFWWPNWRFGLATGAMYSLLSWIMPRMSPAPGGLAGFGGTVERAIRAAAQPSCLAISALVLLAFIIFTDSKEKWFRRFAGVAHGAAHLLCALIGSWTTYMLLDHLGIEPVYDDATTALTLASLGASLAGTFLFGAVIGPLVMGIYLYVSVNVFGRHFNEAYSSLQLETYKNFLRLHIDVHGTLTIYPVGLLDVPRLWKSAVPTAERPQRMVPERGSVQAELIEEPIVIPVKIAERPPRRTSGVVRR